MVREHLVGTDSGGSCYCQESRLHIRFLSSGPPDITVFPGCFACNVAYVEVTGADPDADLEQTAVSIMDAVNGAYSFECRDIRSPTISRLSVMLLLWPCWEPVSRSTRSLAVGGVYRSLDVSQRSVVLYKFTV